MVSPHPPQTPPSKFDMEDVPWGDEAKVSAWLTQRFVEKNDMLGKFYAGAGPLLDGAREESSSWRDIFVDLALWTGVQYAFYGFAYHLGRAGLACLGRQLSGGK